MPRAYDDWEKLVGAVLKREELKRIALCESFSSSTFDASLEDVPALYRSSSQSNLYYGIGVRPIALEEIKRPIRKYRAVKQGGLGIVLKGWIDEHALTASTPTTGMAVAVKWNHGGLQEHEDWLGSINRLLGLRESKWPWELPEDYPSCMAWKYQSYTEILILPTFFWMGTLMPSYPTTVWMGMMLAGTYRAYRVKLRMHTVEDVNSSLIIHANQLSFTFMEET